MVLKGGNIRKVENHCSKAYGCQIGQASPALRNSDPETDELSYKEGDLGRQALYAWFFFFLIYFIFYGCILLKIIFILYAHVFACIHVYVSHTCLVPEEARRWHQIPIELELPMVVCCHVGVKNQNFVLCKRSKSS